KLQCEVRGYYYEIPMRSIGKFSGGGFSSQPALTIRIASVTLTSSVQNSDQLQLIYMNRLTTYDEILVGEKR
ncbi:MAG TPA: hypothetical protein VIV66_03565, partial [Pyrinomonadaceae bacterium]